VRRLGLNIFVVAVSVAGFSAVAGAAPLHDTAGGSAMGLASGAKPELVEGNWRLTGAAWGLGAAGGDVGVVDLTARTRPHKHVGIVMSGRIGWLRSDDQDAVGHLDADHLYTALAVGPVLTTGENADGWELQGGILFTHVHHAPMRTWKDDAGGNLSGDSSSAVQHRSGLEITVGATTPEFFRLGEYAGIGTIDLAAGMLPSSDQLAWSAGLRLGIGLRTLDRL